MDEHQVIEIVKEQHKSDKELCKIQFLPIQKAMAALWTLATTLIVIFGASIAWALNTNSTVSKHDTQIIRISQDVEILKANSNKLDTLCAQQAQVIALVKALHK